MQFNENTTLSAMEKTISAEVQGKELWGDISFSENEYDYLRERIKAVLHNSASVDIARISRLYPCAFTTFLVFMSRYKYDTNFWGLVEAELEISISSNIHSELGSNVRSTFKKYGFDLSDVKDATWINIEPVLFEAGLPPESSLDDLFYILNYDSHSIFDPQLIIEDLIGMRSYHIRKPMYRFLNRFQDDRAIEFVLEVHDSMLTVDQNRSGESRYIGRYADWKSHESTKEYGNSRKKQEFQTRPYLSFENGKRGLCMVLPRIVLEKEWIDDVEWIITFDDGHEVSHRMSVFGDNGRRYVQSIDVPVNPSSKYIVSLIDRESLDGDEILKWDVEGIKAGNVIFFNANGRMTSPNYLLMPYGIAVMSDKAEILDTKHITTLYQAYPTDREGYKVLTIQPNGRDAVFVYRCSGITKSLKARPQINLKFEGAQLFGIEDEKNRLFTEIPKLIIEIDDGVSPDGLNIRIGKDDINIDDMFTESIVELELRKYFKKQVKEYGTYSIRLYQYDRFLRQIEFSYVPKIKSNYSPIMKWPDKILRKENKTFKFEKKDDWIFEFDDCIVNSDEAHYTVECPSDICVINGRIRSTDEDNSFCCGFELPVNPLAIEILDSNGLRVEEVTDKVTKLGLSDLDAMEYWVGFECFGQYKECVYSLVLRNANGIEQSECLRLSQNGSSNINLSCFYDTLRNCPLPAQIELCCKNSEEQYLPILVVADTVELSSKPSLARGKEKDFISLSLEDGEKDVVVKKYGRDSFEITLLASSARLNKAGNKKGFMLPNRLGNGIYTVENKSEDKDFLFEDEASIEITNGRNMLYVSSRETGMPIKNFSDWLDQLIKDILSAGVNSSISNGKAYAMLRGVGDFNEDIITADDYEKLVLIAEFINAKCIDAKKEAMRECMRQISYKILDGSKRLELVRILADLQCEKDIFDICLQEYNLLLFEVGSEDAKELANKLENKSAELALLLLMGIDAPVKETIWKEKFRELIGKEAIKSLLAVPGVEDPKIIKMEQKKFFREDSPCAVRINLTNEISGDMLPIQGMLEITHKSIRFNIAKKPDFGLYFAHIRYVDQYVNWHTLSHDKDLNMDPKKKEMMISVVKNNCQDMMDAMKQLETVKDLGKILKDYDKALKARTTGDIFLNLNVNDSSRYFYLQGIAAFFAVLPKEYRKYGWAVRLGEGFMSYATEIAPRISKRDLIMASTFIYLKRKEEMLCR